MTTKTATKTKIKADEVKTKSSVVVTISIRDLVDRLLGIKATTFCQIWQTSKPSMNKTGNRFYGKVTKTNSLNCLTGYQYADMVNNARARESKARLTEAMLAAGVPQDKIDGFFGEVNTIVENAAKQFESAGLPWGEYFIDPRTSEKSRCIIEHTPKSGDFADKKGFYMQVAVMNSADPVYKWKETGIELTEAEVSEMKKFFPKKKDGAKQGLAKPYIIRSPRLDGFDAITFAGVNYQPTE